MTPLTFSTVRLRSRFASKATSTTRSSPAPRVNALIRPAGSSRLRFTTRSAPASLRKLDRRLADRARTACDQHGLSLDAAVLEQTAMRGHSGDTEAGSGL